MRRRLVASFALAGFVGCGGGGGGGGGGTDRPTTHTLSGTVTSSAAGNRAITGATVAIGDGANAGRTATTDGSGAYSLSGLQPSSFTATASAAGYASSAQAVTLTGNLTLNFQLADLALPLAERVGRHLFPRLAHQVQGYTPAPDLLLALADWDVLVVDAELAANDRASFLGPHGTLRQRNQNLVVLTYFSAADVIPGNTATVNGGFIAGLDDRWYMKDTAGRRVRLFDLGGGTWSEMLNLTTGVNEFMPRHLNEKVLSTGLSDGIFYDWVNDDIAWLNHRDPSPSGPLDIDDDARPDDDARLNELWVAGMCALLDSSRSAFPSGTLVAGNGGWITGDAYDTRLNGLLIEQFLEGEALGAEQFGWSAVMRSYGGHCAHAQSPQVTFIMANRDAREEHAFMRFALASALMFDGYFCFTNRSGLYGSDWWYDEYAVDIGSGRAERAAAYKGYLGVARGSIRGRGSSTCWRPGGCPPRAGPGGATSPTASPWSIRRGRPSPSAWRRRSGRSAAPSIPASTTGKRSSTSRSRREAASSC